MPPDFLEHPAPGVEAGCEHFLHAAARMGERLAAAAAWTGDACTWPPSAGGPARGGELYQGSAGIALFLAELAAVTGSAACARAALGGAAHALARARSYSDASFGLHSGRVGIAYAAARIGTLLDARHLLAEADDVLRPLAGNAARDRGLDVVTGAAGAIPALLWLAPHVDAARATGLARDLGDHLLRTAVREPGGWSWACMPPGTVVRNLCGYAHGASGMGHALLELYAATGDGRYRYGAEQAFLYERGLFDAVEGNWPDLRRMEVIHAAARHDAQALAAATAAVEREAEGDPQFSVAWCHGAPGIGLARLRAWEVLGDPLYRDEARVAAASAAASLAGDHDWSLCHGLCGNADVVLHAARGLDEPALLRSARALGDAGIARYEARGVRWPCGTSHGAPDPGLMLGEAGIGWFLLRLARPDVPSPLRVCAADAAAARGGRAGAAGYAAERAATVDAHLGGTLARFRALGVDVLLPNAPMGPAPRRGDAELALDAVAARVAAEPDADRRALLEDAFAVDRARAELARADRDHSRGFLHALSRVAEDAVERDGVALVLVDGVRLVSTAWDWDGWMASGAKAPGPGRGEGYALVRSRGGQAAAHAVSAFAWLVLGSLRTPARVDAVVLRVADAVAADGSPDPARLRGAVLAQVRQACRAGLLVRAG